MATAALTNTPTSIADGESITGWSGDTFSLEPDIKVEGSNSVACAQTVNGNNDAIFTKATGSWDFSSGEHLRLWFNSSAVPTYADIASNGGIQIGLDDGTNTDWFYVGGADTYGGGWEQIVLYTLTTPDVDNGADLSAITNITWRMATVAKPRNVPANLWLDAWYYGDGYTVTGGTSGDEIDWSHIAAVDKISAYNIVQEFEGVYFLAGEVTVGDGVSATWFKPTSQIVVFKDLEVLSTLYQLIFYDDSSLVTNVDISGGTWTASGTQRFTFDASAILNNFDMDGVQISRLDAGTLHVGASVTNTVFSDCFQIDPSSSTFQNNTIANSTDTSGAILYPATDTNFKNNTFINNDIAIEQDTVDEPTYDNLQFSGNTTDIHNSISATAKDAFTTQDTGTSLEDPYDKFGQTFTAATSFKLTRAEFKLYKLGTPTGNMRAELWSITGTVGTDAVPDTLLATSKEYPATDADGSDYEWFNFEFDDSEFYDVVSTTGYAIVIHHAEGDAVDRLLVGKDSAAGHGGNYVAYSGSWDYGTSYDNCFQLFADGDVTVAAVNDSNPSSNKLTYTGSPVGVTNINNAVNFTIDNIVYTPNTSEVYVEAEAGGPLSDGDEIIKEATTTTPFVKSLAFVSDQPFRCTVANYKGGAAGPSYTPYTFTGTITADGFYRRITQIQEV